MSEQQVPQGTVAEVLDWVGQDPGRARAALDAECAGANRSSLINQIEPIANRPEGNTMESSSSPSSSGSTTEQEQSATSEEPADTGSAVATQDRPVDESPTSGSELDR